MSLRCYMLELEVIFFEEDIEDNVVECILRFSDTLPPENSSVSPVYTSHYHMHSVSSLTFAVTKAFVQLFSRAWTGCVKLVQSPFNTVLDDTSVQDCKLNQTKPFMFCHSELLHFELIQCKLFTRRVLSLRISSNMFNSFCLCVKMFLPLFWIFRSIVHHVRRTHLITPQYSWAD